jgi:hypothetical protein
MIHKLVDNKVKGETSCEKMFGNKTRVKNVGGMWNRYGELFEIMMTQGLVDYAENRVFTKDEYEAYKLGLAYIPTIMEQCLIEIEKGSQGESS